MKKITLSIFIICTGVMASAQQKFQLPKYTTFKLPNGLTVNLMEQKEVPLISVALSVPAASIHDGEQAGLSELTAASLVSGSKNFTKDQIQEKLDFAGANLNAYSRQEFTRVYARFSAKTQDVVFSLLKDVVINPTFEANEFEKLKTRQKASLEVAKQSPFAVINYYWNAMMYANHVYSKPSSGLISTVNAVTAADAKKFHEKFYRPNGSVLAIVGDFNTAEMKSKITALFGEWKKANGTIANPAAEPVKMPETANVLLVNKADARETTFYIGAKGIAKNNADRVAIDVVNTVLGDRFTSWLNDELRVNSGLTYGAGSRFDANKYAGTFKITSFTATKTTFQTIDKALEVMDRLQKGIDDTTLLSARNYVVGLFPTEYETSGQLAALLNDMFIYGYDAAYINDFEKNVSLVTPVKAKEIISRYFSKNKLQFLLIGKADEIREGAKKYGTVIEKEIKEDSYEVKGKKAF
ncbi:MAG: insulinase family protein [Chitinophagaceae bacterium]|nr:MAG: insulinase family protein [Chitinophagaceae bacterium]